VPDLVYHFSEDLHIERFEPHVPPTNPGAGAHVWAIDAEHAPLYWFPRDCPRVTVWAADAPQRAALEARFATRASRVHWMERAWVPRFESAQLYVYAFDAAPFVEWTSAEGQWVADQPIEPVDVRPLDRCRSEHERAGVDLRVVDHLWPFVDAVVDSGLPFSIVRIRNAQARDLTGG